MNAASTTATADAKVIRFSQTRKPVRSSWITDIRYRNGFLAVFTNDGTAMMYGPHLDIDLAGMIVNVASAGDILLLLARFIVRMKGVPSWVAGLVKAGTGRRSPGLAFNRLVKSKGYAYQRVTGKEKMKELKEMMK